MSRNASNTSATTAASPTITTASKSSGMPPSTPPLSPSVTKLCHIVKRPDFEGYGFNLHSEKVKPGQYIGKVDSNSPAESAGLKEGDRIIEVNDVAIGSETHKQVVQRIKAIACEVRLLLIDVDGKGDGRGHSHADVKDNKKQNAAPVMPSSSPTEQVPITVNSNNSKNKSNTTEEYNSTVQEMPGVSANISSISMTSTKRMSNASNQSQNGHTSNNKSSHNNNNSDISMDVTDKAVNIAAQVIGTDVAIAQSQNINNNTVGASSSLIKQERNGTSQQQQAAMKPNNNMTTTITPPPPSAAVAIVPTQQQQQQQQAQAFPTAFSITGLSSTSTTAATTTSNTNQEGGNQFGSLKLPMTAAEMRAKLLTKKKFDPKNESVDLKKKFEIIQKL